MLLLACEVGPVFKYIRILDAGAIEKNHPWATGLDTKGAYIWPQNIAYQSPSHRFELANDHIIATKLGMFLRSMVKRSLPHDPEIPQSQKRRMPHAVNYIHGSIHYNGALMIFDDFADLRAHLGNKKFRKDIKRFIKREKREVTFVLREREFDPTEYAYCVAAMRVYLPYFTNGNGPSKKPVLWGNKSPYLAINSINGAWMEDMDKLVNKDTISIVRSPISTDAFSTKDGVGYALYPREVKWIEKLYAWLMFLDVRLRGFAGQLFFTKRALIEPKRRQEYKDAGGYWKWTNINPVPHPFRFRNNSTPTPPQKTSVIIATLNEEDRIEDCIKAVRNAFAEKQLNEIIVVDANSSDKTASLVRALGAKIHCTQKAGLRPGRGFQMAYGASVASGDLLFFLHADATLSTRSGEKIERFFSKPNNKICTLRLRFPSPNPVYKALGWATRLDGRVFSFGDQGILVRRSFYEQIGGMPKQALFEDVEFLQRARKQARISSLNAKIYVSNRRFKRNGVLRELLHNIWLGLRYSSGETPDQLAKSYQNFRKKI